MKNCDACGKSKSFVSVGGAALCRECDPVVREQMNALRQAGKPVNVLHIARRLYKETYSGGNYLLRDYPDELWKRLQHQAIEEKCSVRDLILRAVDQYLASH